MDPFDYLNDAVAAAIIDLKIRPRSQRATSDELLQLLDTVLQMRELMHVIDSVYSDLPDEDLH